MNRCLMTALAACVLLTGCGRKSDDSKAQAAGGEVLPGTVSDAMIDSDRSQAQAPLLAPSPAAGTRSTGDAGAAAVKGSEASPSENATAEAEAAAPAAKASVPAPADAVPKPAASKPAVTPKPVATAKPKPSSSRPAG